MTKTIKAARQAQGIRRMEGSGKRQKVWLDIKL